MSTTWLKPEDSVKRAWFQTLERFAATVDLYGTMPKVDPDHFLYTARIERPGRADIHVYRHLITGKSLYIDEDGNAYRFAGTDRHRNPRYDVLGHVREAVDRLDLYRGNLIAGHLRANALVTPEEEEEPRTRYPIPFGARPAEDGDPGPTPPPDESDEPNEPNESDYPDDPDGPIGTVLDIADLEVATPGLDPEARADAGFDDDLATVGSSPVPHAVPA